MPIDPSIIGAGAGLLGGIVSNVSQAIQNRNYRKWTEQQYDKQRSDALADWQRQTDYNHPSAQMARLREAGINPRVAFTGGSAVTTAATVRSTDQKPAQPAPLDFGYMGETVGKYFQIQAQKQTVDNLKAQNTLVMQEAANKALQAAQITGKTALTKWELENKQRLADLAYKTMEANLTKIQTSTQISLDQNERAAAMQGYNIKESITRVLRMKSEMANNVAERQRIAAQIKQIEQSVELGKFELELNKMGMTKGDELWQRLIAKGITNPMDLLEGIKEGIGSLFKFW